MASEVSAKTILSKDNFKTQVLQIFKDFGYQVREKPIANVKGWTYEITVTAQSRSLDTNFFYLKWDSSIAFLTARYNLVLSDVQGDRDKLVNAFLHGAKTINLELFHNLTKAQPLIVFADPHNIRAVPYFDVWFNGIKFTQKSNSELVMGVDVDDLLPLREVLKGYRKRYE